jgi:hypothetical protein
MSISFKLEDFFPYYTSSSLPPDEIDELYNSTFYNTIPRKKEFDECRAPYLDKLTNDGTPWAHQQFMSRFMSPNTPYQNILVFHGMGTGKCVHPKTLVNTVTGKFFIGDLWHYHSSKQTLLDYTFTSNSNSSLGEWRNCNKLVYTIDNNSNKLVVRTIQRVYREFVNTMLNKVVVKVDNLFNSKYIELECTQMHQLYVINKGYTNNYSVGDKVLIANDTNTYDLSTAIITKVEKYHYKGYVYDLEVENTHNYFANGILTHNTCLMAAVGEYAKQILPSLNKVIILVKNDTLKKNVIDDIATKCTINKYNITTDPKTGKPLSNDSRLIRVTNAVSKNYSIMTYYDFAKTLKSVDPSMYDNSYIIIDEAHNLRDKKGVGRTGINVYKSIHKCLHSVKGTKVLLLTGTPMRNSSSEIVGLMNLILPINKQMNEENWNEKYFQKDDNLKDNSVTQLQQYFYGNVSYLRSPTGNVKILYPGSIEYPLKYTVCYELEMDKYQTEKYSVYYERDKQKQKDIDLSADDEVELDEEDDLEDDGKKSLWINSRQASSFIFPNGECGILTEKKYLDIDYGGDLSKTRIQNFNLSKHMIDYLTLNDTINDINGQLSRLKTLSIKFWFLIKQILDNPTKKTFIYSNFVMGGGIVLLAALLKFFGFSNAPTKGFGTDAYPKEKRFLLLSSKTMNPEQMRVGVREIFNNRSNVDGDYIQVILGSRIIGEGISFLHCRQMFLLTPNWNNATTEQVIARVVRADSHPDWMENKVLEIYRLDAKPIVIFKSKIKKIIDSKSIDTIMYYTSEVKDIRIKQIERIMKQSAIDCSLNRDRNILESDKPFTINCDYMSQCDYECFYVDPKYYSASYSSEHPNEVITDTYHTYFAFKQITKITDKIKELFSFRNVYDFEEMYSILKKDIQITSFISGIVLARALQFMISSNLKIRNKFGFINYLREDNNLYFLVDDAASSTTYTSAYYAAHPMVDSTYSNKLTNTTQTLVLSDYYNEESTVNRIYKLLMEEIKNKNYDKIKTIILNLDPLVSIDWIENAYDNHNFDDPKFILSNTIYTLFKNVFKTIELNGIPVIVNFFNKNEIRYKDPYDGRWKITNENEKEQIIEKRLEQIDVVKEKFGYYSMIDEKGIFRIKEVAPIQFTKKGDIDSRISRELGALKCGTGKLAKGGLVYRILLISLKALEAKFTQVLEDLHMVPPLNTREKDYRENLKPFVDRYILNKEILKHLLKIDKKERKKVFEKMSESVSQKSEDYQLLLRCILQAKDNTEVDYLGDDNIQAIVRELEDVTYLKDYFKIKNVISDIEFLNSLPNEVKNALAKSLKYKANTICGSLRNWFEINGLVV